MTNAKGGPRDGGRRPGVRLDGEELRRLRIDVHTMTTTDVARKIGMARTTIEKAERSQVVARITAARIALALGANLEDLLLRDPADVAS